MIPSELIPTIWTMIGALVTGIIAWLTIRVQAGNSRELELINELQEEVTVASAEKSSLKTELRIKERERLLYQHHALELHRYINNGLKGERPLWPMRSYNDVSKEVTQEIQDDLDNRPSSS